MTAEIPTLSTLVKRLEVATLKLEEFAKTSAAAAAINRNSIPAASQSGSTSTTNSATAGASAAVATPPRGDKSQKRNGSISSGDSPAVVAFNSIVEGPLARFMQLAQQIGGVVAEQAVQVQNAVQHQLTFLRVASNCTKPDLDSAVFNHLIAPTRQSIQAVTSLKDQNRQSPYFNHLASVSEGIPAMAWIVVDTTPGPYVGDMKEAAQFYSNRVMKEHRDTGKDHVEWAGAFNLLLSELQKYIRQYHPTGVTWNPRGRDVQSYVDDLGGSIPSSTPSASGGAPPAPPPPPPVDASSPSGTGGESMSAVFSQLNVGEGITSGLRKVSKSEMTHKNPALRASSVVKAASGPTGKRFSGEAKKGEPKMELQGNKWIVEYHEDATDLIIENTSIKQTVYVYGCSGCVLQVKGKINALSMDNCKKTAVVVDTTVSSIDIINSKSCQMQILNRSPVCIVDKSDGLQLYLSPQSLDTELLTAKSSEVNVLMQEKEGADFKELCVPEQFKTLIVNGRLVTTPVDHAG